MDIYKITNKVNGKIYIGKAQYGYKNRFKEHLQTAKSKRYSVSHLYSAMNKYGYDNFYVEKIDERDTIEELNDCEKYWISKLDSTNPSIGYNLEGGGNGGNFWDNLTPDEKDTLSSKISEKSLGRVMITKNNKMKRVKECDFPKYELEGWVKGGPSFTEEHKKKQSEALNSLVTITNGEINKKIRPEDIDKYPGFYIGYVYKPSEKQLKYNEERRKKSLLKNEQELHNWLKDEHYCKTCGKLMTEKYGSGVYCCRKCASTHKHTDETKKLLSDMNKAGVCGNKGKKLTEEHKKKISDAHKGKIVSEETRKKISESKKGTTPWNKGLTKEDPRVKANVDKRNKTMLNTYSTLNGYIAHTMKEETYEN